MQEIQDGFISTESAQASFFEPVPIVVPVSLYSFRSIL